MDAGPSPRHSVRADLAWPFPDWDADTIGSQHAQAVIDGARLTLQCWSRGAREQVDLAGALWSGRTRTTLRAMSKRGDVLAHDLVGDGINRDPGLVEPAKEMREPEGIGTLGGV